MPVREWMGPPEGWLGGFVPGQLVLAKTSDLVVSLGPMKAFPTGVEIAMTITSREPRGGPMMGFGGLGWPDDGGPLIGIGLSDGSKWQSGRSPLLPFSVEEPAAPYVHFHGGGGGGTTYRMELWLWPLPPEGPVTFAFAWSAKKIEEITAVVDGEAFRTAAGQAEKLWEPLTPEEQRAAHEQLIRQSGQRPAGASGTMTLRAASPPSPDRPDEA
jgi:hypothetical protein